MGRGRGVWKPGLGAQLMWMPVVAKHFHLYTYILILPTADKYQLQLVTPYLRTCLYSQAVWNKHLLVHIYAYLRSETYNLLFKTNAGKYIFSPVTIVSSGISSMKHFLSVSPIWKYRPSENAQKTPKIRHIERCVLDVILLSLLD